MGEPLDPQATVPQPPASPVLTFDEDGDLRLRVGGGTGAESRQQQQQTFVVCSRTLARASRPFKAMLYGDSAESKPSQGGAEWTVALPEDDCCALATLMYIIHGDFVMVPSLMERDELYEITILTDKYDMTEVVRPWVQTWIERFAESTPCEDGDEKLLWIAWVLGHGMLFSEVLEWLQNSCQLNQSNQLCCPSGDVLEDNIHLRSLGIVDKLKAERTRVLASMLTCVSNVINQLADFDDQEYPCRASLSGAVDEKISQENKKMSQECRLFYLGSVMKSLKDAGCYPLWTPASLHDSIKTVRYRLDSIARSIEQMEKINAGTGRDHKKCSPGPSLKAKLSHISACIDLSSKQYSHLSDQGEKSGVLG